MSLKSSSINLWRQMFETSISKLVNSIGVILFIVILSLEFSVDEIGIYFFLFAVVNLLSNIAGGLGKAVRKRVSAKQGKQSGYLTTAMVSTFILQLVITMVIVAIVLFIPRDYLPQTLQGITMPLLLSSLLLLFTQSTGKIMINYNSGLGYPSRSEWLGRALPGTLFFLLSIVIISLGLGLAHIFVAGAFSFGLSAVLMLFTTKPDLRESPSYEKLKSLLQFGKWSIPNKIIMDFYNGLDVIVLGLLVTSTAVGYYESSNNLAHLVYTIPYGLSAVMSVKVSGLDAENRTGEIKKIIRDSIPISISIPIGFLFLFILFGETILDLIYGPEFVGAYLFLVGLSIKEVLLSYRSPIQSLNYGLDQPRIPFYANILSVGFNIITIIPLVQIFGGIGVVMSTILAEIVRIIIISYLTQEFIKALNYKKMIVPIIVVIPTYGLFWGIKHIVESNHIVFLAILSVSFVITYISALYIVLDHQTTDLDNDGEKEDE